MVCGNWLILDWQSGNMSVRPIDYVRHWLGSCKFGVNSIPLSVLWAWIPDPSWLQPWNTWVQTVLYKTCCRVIILFLGVNCLCISCYEKGCALHLWILAQLQAKFKLTQIWLAVRNIIVAFWILILFHMLSHHTYTQSKNKVSVSFCSKGSVLHVWSVAQRSSSLQKHGDLWSSEYDQSRCGVPSADHFSHFQIECKRGLVSAMKCQMTC